MMINLKSRKNRRKLLTACVLVFLTISVAWIVAGQNYSAENESMQVQFSNIENNKIKESFLKVLESYESLHGYDVKLTQERIGASTMQAQPIINLVSLFTGVKKYEIKLGVYVRDSEELAVADVPKDVLTGWFAHELGHLVDYEPRSNFMMAVYGLRYYFSEKFKRKVEHEADYIAIEHGFKDEIIATKKFILEHNLVEDEYKEKIRKYYLSVEDVIVCTKDEPLMKPKVKSS